MTVVLKYDTVQKSLIFVRMKEANLALRFPNSFQRLSYENTASAITSTYLFYSGLVSFRTNEYWWVFTIQFLWNHAKMSDSYKFCKFSSHWNRAAKGTAMERTHKKAKKELWRSEIFVESQPAKLQKKQCGGVLFLTIWHCIFNVDSTKTHSSSVTFWRFCRLG